MFVCVVVVPPHYLFWADTIFCYFFFLQVGENGAGKTTLLKIVMGILNPTKGLRHVHRNLKFGYFSQHHVDQLDMTQNSVELLQSTAPGKYPSYFFTFLKLAKPPHQIKRVVISSDNHPFPQWNLSGKRIEEYRRQLGSFGISGDLALQQIASLSGGQKSRVAFARMCLGNPNFLVLDEPTNHLDIESIEALGKAIQKYTVSLRAHAHTHTPLIHLSLIKRSCKRFL